MEVRTQKRPFSARVLRYFHMLEAFTILCCHWRRLSLPFYKTFAMIIFLFLKSCSVYFSMELFIGFYWIFKNIPLEIVGGGLKWYEYVRNRGGS